MADLNDNIKKKLSEYEEPIGKICLDVVKFAQNMPDIALKDHLDNLVRRAVKNQEAGR